MSFGPVSLKILILNLEQNVSDILSFDRIRNFGMQTRRAVPRRSRVLPRHMDRTQSSIPAVATRLQNLWGTEKNND